MKVIKKILCLFIIIGQLVVLAGCLSNLETPEEKKTYKSYNFTYFDTVSTIIGEDEQTKFTENANNAFKVLGEYHQLFDIYHEYSGINNLCTINKMAGGEALVVDQKLIDFLKYAKEIYDKTLGKTNVMLGSVLKLWHDARETKDHVPSIEDLTEANLHTSFELLEIDEENNTVKITDPKAQIDVGALGKGYATEKAAKMLEDIGCTGYVLNIGGNIRIIGAKGDGSSWKTGITDPFGGYDPIITIMLKDTSCVTSGDYERYYTFEGKKYHHIIDKDTLMPADYFSSITVLVKDSGLADALSTALFAMPLEQGKELVASLEGVDVIWVDKEGQITYTDGVKSIIYTN